MNIKVAYLDGLYPVGDFRQAKVNVFPLALPPALAYDASVGDFVRELDPHGPAKGGRVGVGFVRAAFEEKERMNSLPEFEVAKSVSMQYIMPSGENCTSRRDTG